MPLYIKYHLVSSGDSLDCAPAGQDFIENETISNLIKRIGLDANQDFMVFVNRNPASLDTRLTDEDRVDIFPAIGGG